MFYSISVYKKVFGAMECLAKALHYGFILYKVLNYHLKFGKIRLVYLF